MIFNEDELKLLLEFYNHCYNTSLVNEERSGAWCQSYFTYEVLQGLILGDDRYVEHPWPCWLKNRPKYRTHGPIKRHIKAKRDTFNLLNNGLKDETDKLLICEIGYGTDLVIAMMTKGWAEVKSYDQNPYMKEPLLEFFGERHGVNLDFICKPSNYYSFGEISEPTIVLSNFCHISVDIKAKEIKENNNIIFVRNGELVDKETIPLETKEFRKVFHGGYL